MAFINEHRLYHVAEIGVWKGEFAAAILEHCPSIQSYILVDPWRHQARWNKPFNVDDETFEQVYEAAVRNTEFAANKRRIIRATTLQARDTIDDGSLDFAYIDGDHTLRGIVLDTLSIWPKIKIGGFLGGDDFVDDVWQHGPSSEPTLVKPFICYFAEAVGGRLRHLPHNQFVIEKTAEITSRAIDGDSSLIFDLKASLQTPIPSTTQDGNPRAGRFRSAVNKVRSLARRSLEIASPRFREQRFSRLYNAPFPEMYHRTGVVFIHVPKAAGTSIGLTLYGRSFGHVSLEQLIRNYPHSMSRLPTFAVLRDPAERFVSAFDFLKRGGMNSHDEQVASTYLSAYRTASECAESLIDGCAQHAMLQCLHFRPQVSWIAAPAVHRFVDCVVPLGKLALLQDWLNAQIGRAVVFPILNASPVPSEQRLDLTEHAARVLRLVYADDYRVWQALCVDPACMISPRSSRLGRNPRLERTLIS